MINRLCYPSLYILYNLVDPFKVLKGDNLSRNSVLRKNAASAYQLFFVIGIASLVISLIIAGLIIAYSKKSSKKSEIKESLIKKAFVAIIFFSFISIIGIVYGVILKLT